MVANCDSLALFNNYSVMPFSSLHYRRYGVLQTSGQLILPGTGKREVEYFLAPHQPSIS